MPGYAVVGIQWGDEAKGKVVDYLADRVECVARFQGGNNAGHTVVAHGKEYVFHLLPSGIVHPDVSCIIGNGTVVDPRVLLDEMDKLAGHKIDYEGRLWLSDCAHIIMPYHRTLDGADEDGRRQWRIGTTGRGIGPVYSDKVSRSGIRAGDLIDESLFREKLVEFLPLKNRLLIELFGESDPISFDRVCDEYIEYGRRLRPYICDTVVKINSLLDEGKSVMFEGAQGALLDVDHGTYPFVTASTTVAGGICGGLGIGPSRIDKVIGVVKAYTTRVGQGPFPTELGGRIGQHLLEKGYEYGRTTGRARRCGWFDAIAIRRGVMVNGTTSLALSKLDVLSGIETIKLCTSYNYRGQPVDQFPSNPDALGECEPIYETMPGWSEPISNCRSFDDLPGTAQAYIRRVEELAGCPVSILSIGPARNDTILMNDPLA